MAETEDTGEGNFVAETVVDMTQVVLPQDTNPFGNVFGGQVVGWIDICAAVAAQRHCRRPVVTASIDEVHFVSPIKLGHVVLLKGQINAAFRTSMECGVEVISEHPLSGRRELAVSALLTFVALDDEGNPTPVPTLVPRSPEERLRQQQATQRRALRLQHRQKPFE